MIFLTSPIRTVTLTTRELQLTRFCIQNCKFVHAAKKMDGSKSPGRVQRVEASAKTSFWMFIPGEKGHQSAGRVFLCHFNIFFDFFKSSENSFGYLQSFFPKTSPLGEMGFLLAFWSVALGGLPAIGPRFWSSLPRGLPSDCRGPVCGPACLA